MRKNRFEFYKTARDQARARSRVSFSRFRLWLELALTDKARMNAKVRGFWKALDFQITKLT